MTSPLSLDYHYQVAIEVYDWACIESLKVYRMKILLLELKILMNIHLGVICTHMIDFHRPGLMYRMSIYML